MTQPYDVAEEVVYVKEVVHYTQWTVMRPQQGSSTQATYSSSIFASQAHSAAATADSRIWGLVLPHAQYFLGGMGANGECTSSPFTAPPAPAPPRWYPDDFVPPMELITGGVYADAVADADCSVP